MIKITNKLRRNSPKTFPSAHTGFTFCLLSFKLNNRLRAFHIELLCRSQHTIHAINSYRIKIKFIRSGKLKVKNKVDDLSDCN